MVLPLIRISRVEIVYVCTLGAWACPVIEIAGLSKAVLGACCEEGD
jgi:hypothetical protein